MIVHYVHSSIALICSFPTWILQVFYFYLCFSLSLSLSLSLVLGDKLFPLSTTLIVVWCCLIHLVSLLLLFRFPICYYCFYSCFFAICFCVSRLLQQCLSFAILLHFAHKVALIRPTQIVATIPAIIVWPHLWNKKKSPKTKPFPIPKIKEKSTRREQWKSNNSR